LGALDLRFVLTSAPSFILMCCAADIRP